MYSTEIPYLVYSKYIPSTVRRYSKIQVQMKVILKNPAYRDLLGFFSAVIHVSTVNTHLPYFSLSLGRSLSWESQQMDLGRSQ